MSDNNIQARVAALLTVENFTPTPTSLISYQSNGRVIAFGDSFALEQFKSVSAPLSFTSIQMTDARPNPDRKDFILLANRTIDIQGYLGNFTIHLTNAQAITETFEADIILDLNPSPLVTQELLPPGYLHRPKDAQSADEILLELSEMTGEFEKPKYFKYNADICAHGVNGAQFCTNCIEACPADAIHSLGDKIEVNPHLCQGGGTCATACPSGAIQYAYPRLSDSGNQIRTLLQTYREQGGLNPIVVFHNEEDFAERLLTLNSTMLPIKVEEIASVGVDLCLSTIVYGASQVVLLANSAVPGSSLSQLEHQINWLGAALVGLDINPAIVSIQRDLDAVEVLDTPSPLEPAIYTMPDLKRNAIYQALDHLYKHSAKNQVMVDLPQGAPFGAAVIDEESCTLCMACVGACPGKALQDGSNREVPEVFFIESNCIQCNVCTLTCPEQAITLTPRIIFDREQRNRSRALSQDTPFGCITCGKPFASTSVIKKMNEKLKDHYMFQGARALDRLKMCEDCRVVDIVQDDNAMNGRFDSIN
ncbi:MAG: ferredoxin [Gammaproteobacteria bacterium]|jgi:ferredoxin